MQVWQNFKTWLQQPFTEGMDAFHWFLFFGLLIAISIGWSFVLKHTIGSIE